MTHDALTRVEAMLVALRDQVDRLTERVEVQLDRHERLLVRLQGAVGEASWALREELLEVRGLAGCARCAPEPAGEVDCSLEHEARVRVNSHRGTSRAALARGVGG